jgi:YggT family protein
VLDLIATLLQVYFFAVFAWVILSWIRVSSTHPLGRIQHFLDRIIYPVILPIRRVVPPIDLSPIILLIGTQILISIIRSL